MKQYLFELQAGKERTMLLRCPNSYEKDVSVVLAKAKWKQAFCESSRGFPGEWDLCILSKYLSSDSLMKCQLVTVHSLSGALAWDTCFTAEVPFVPRSLGTPHSPVFFCGWMPPVFWWPHVGSVIKRHFLTHSFGLQINSNSEKPRRKTLFREKSWYLKSGGRALPFDLWAAQDSNTQSSKGPWAIECHLISRMRWQPFGPSDQFLYCQRPRQGPGKQVTNNTPSSPLLSLLWKMWNVWARPASPTNSSWNLSTRLP